MSNPSNVNIVNLKNTITKEGTHNLTKNFERLKNEEDFVSNDNKTTKKVTLVFECVTAVSGYNDFSQEELRSIDLKFKKNKSSSNSILNKNEGMNLGWNANNLNVKNILLIF